MKWLRRLQYNRLEMKLIETKAALTEVGKLMEEAKVLPDYLVVFRLDLSSQIAAFEHRMAQLRKEGI